MNQFEIGDQVQTEPGSVGIVRAVDWSGVTIHWPKAFGWSQGRTAWYTQNDIQKWGIEKVVEGDERMNNPNYRGIENDLADYEREEGQRRRERAFQRAIAKRDPFYPPEYHEQDVRSKFERARLTLQQVKGDT